MSFHIRPARADEAERLLDLWRRSDAEPTRTDNMASVTRLIEHDPAALLVAVDDGAIVGSVVAGWDGWRGSIYRLVVAPGYRRQGLARELVAAAEQRLRDVGAVRLHALVVGTDDGAIGFWRATGWEQQQGWLRFAKG